MGKGVGTGLEMELRRAWAVVSDIGSEFRSVLIFSFAFFFPQLFFSAVSGQAHGWMNEQQAHGMIIMRSEGNSSVHFMHNVARCASGL